jgi:hypothetical protein
MKIPQNIVEVAQHLGYPSSLFGFTPQQKQYWQEPGLPWLTQGQLNFTDPMPLDYRGHQALLAIGYMGGNSMAPRFPKGCAVQSAPVWDKANLVLGRVYVYCFRQGTAQDWTYQMGRLVKIGGNYLEVAADNPSPDEADHTIWLLRDNEHEAVWDVREVTHYASYPALL